MLILQWFSSLLKRTPLAFKHLAKILRH
jgi:hypothetical protein